MSGVNLIDFNMPSPVPTPAGGDVKRVGGMKLILPKKPAKAKMGEEVSEVKDEKSEERKVNWKLILLILFAWVMLFKLATWYARRYGK